MNLTIPIYVEGKKVAGSPTVYHARPLFFAAPQARGIRLEQLMQQMARELGERLTDLGKQSRHDDLAAYTFYPTLEQQRFDLVLELRRRTARCRFLFVAFRKFDRRLAFTPSLPDVWFDLAPGEGLRERAVEVLTRHFRALEREDASVNPEADSLTGTATIMPLELTIRPPAVPPPPPPVPFLMLGSPPPLSGAMELRRVGRCLDWLYPDDLDRVCLRDAELAELTRLLTRPERRPVLLVGPRQAGKTVLVHEFVYRQVSRRRSAFRDRRNVWHLSPQRLISGMSYVGQWENRLLSILKESRRRQHVLYFDDLLGLFLAGQTSTSSLSMADVLKPYLERRTVRFLGEITPQALAVLRERDRGFADLFHLLPVPETNEAETLRILIAVQRQLEAQQRCCFDLDVVPAVLDLQRRYGRDAAFPGKAATFLRQLAVKHRGVRATRAAALAEFHARSGLAVTFLDRRARLERQEVLDSLSRQVVGQEHALQAAADVIVIAKARLNDPGRPLATFLFLGPTGVGKTQCAKALAAYLFGDSERLLRFDMNEYGAPGAAARLMGTFSAPEGLLTGAIRRQPFAVVLFDEIEKAYPDVFDLLLQVLGEGRLTDALGRTADFANALIVLTSNLGVRETEEQLGFRRDEAAIEAGFVRAAERFFRPEFFNRLDRVLPFRRLTRAQTRDIARRLIGEVFGREGLVQRKCLLAVEPQALERIVDQGYEPVLGARALKRAVERHLAQPVAAQMAALLPGSFTVVRVYPGPDQLAVHVQALEQVPAVPQPDAHTGEPAAVLQCIRAALDRIDEEFAALRPAGPIIAGQIRPEQYRYFALQELLQQIRTDSKLLGAEVDDARFARHGYPTLQRPDAPRMSHHRLAWPEWDTGSFLREMGGALNVNEYLKDLVNAATAVASGTYAPRLLDLLQRTALLDMLAGSIRTPAAERVVLWVHGLTAERQEAAEQLRDVYLRSLPVLRLEAMRPSVESFPVHGRTLTVDGPHALALARLEAGVHLFCPDHGPIEPVQVDMLPVADGADASAVVAAWLERRGAWLEELGQSKAEAADDPAKVGAVVRVYRTQQAVDLRTGLTGPPGNVSGFLLAALPLPPEITVRGA